MKKVLVLLAMMLGATNMFAFEVNGIKYNVTSEGDLTVEVARKEYVGDIVIPESVIYNNKKYKVTAIGERAFAGMMQLKALTIPQTITTIQQYALSELPNIESVTINCKTVERWFYENYSLKTVVLGNNVKIISDKAFLGCTKLSSLTIPNSVTSIGDMAFQDCALTSLIIPGSVRKLGDGAFAGYVKLEKVIISKGVKLIGGYAFKNCRKLGKITIPTSVTNIGLNAFELCLGLREINIPASLPKMNYNGAFDKYNRDYIHVYQNEENEASSNGLDDTALQTMALSWQLREKMEKSDIEAAKPIAESLYNKLKSSNFDTEKKLETEMVGYTHLAIFYESTKDNANLQSCIQKAINIAQKILKINPNNSTAKSFINDMNN